MKLPPNMHDAHVEAAVCNAKEAVGGFAVDCLLGAARQHGSTLGVGAVMMMGMLDATLEHWIIWHRAQNETLDVAAFLDLVCARLVVASAHVETYRPGGMPAGGVQ